MISSDKVTTISESTDRNSTEVANEESATNGVGSDSKVNYNPNRTDGGVNEEGSKERPAEIGLAHELGHARDVGRGTELPASEYSNYAEPYEDLNNDITDEFNSWIPIPAREAQVREKVENPIRVEQNQPKRKLITRNKWKRYGKY